MKYLKSLSIILMLVLLFAGCRETEEQSTYTFLGGEIQNNAEKYIVMNSPEEEKDTIMLESGNFSRKMENLEPGYYWVKTQNHMIHLYLEPGDSVILNVNDADEKSNIRISGKGAERNRYIQERKEEEIRISQFMGDFYSQPEAIFLKVMDSLEGLRMQKVEMLSDSIASERFLDLEKARIKYDMGLKRLDYPRYYRYLNNDTTYKPGKEYNTSFKDLIVDDTTYISVRAFQSFALRLVEKHATEKMDALEDREGVEFVELEYQSVSDVADTEEVKHFLKYLLLKDQLKYSGPSEQVDKLITQFEEECSKGEYVEEIREMRENWRKLEAGNAAPVFTYPDINGQMVALTDFIGKYVYVDVWATWCGPCRREIPHMEKLMNDYADENIAFVAVSLDEDKDAWMEMVQNKELKGSQLYAGSWSSKIASDYMIRSIPRFLLIDPEGKIIDAKAPRPSSEEIRKIFDEKL